MLDSQEEPGLTYHIGNPLDSGGEEQVVHYDSLKPYTLPLPAGSLSDLLVAPLRAPSMQDEGLPD